MFNNFRMDRICDYDRKTHKMNPLESLKTEALKSLGFSSEDYFRLAKNFTPEKLAYYMQLAFAVGFDAGIKEQREKHANHMQRAVIQLDDKGREVARYDSCGEAGRAVTRAKSGIIGAIKKGQKCGGYFWKYA